MTSEVSFAQQVRALPWQGDGPSRQEVLAALTALIADRVVTVAKKATLGVMAGEELADLPELRDELGQALLAAFAVVLEGVSQ
jgi:hypothetical protein